MSILESTSSKDISIDLEMTPVINYALFASDIPFIRSLTVTNNSAADYENIDISVSASIDAVMTGYAHIDTIAAGGGVDVSDISPDLDKDNLVSIIEREDGSITVTVTSSGDEIYKGSADITALPFDEWQGYLNYPELLASFVTPDYPEVKEVIGKAADILKEKTGDGIFDGYETEDPERAKAQAEAVYLAIQAMGIAGEEPSAEYDSVGQRVRLANTLVSDKTASGLDISLFYASCLESAGLHPIIVLKKDHVYPGLWLSDISFPEMIEDDVLLVSKRLSHGTGELVIVEPKYMTDGGGKSFDIAADDAENNLLLDLPVDCILEINKARQNKIVSLPVRTLKDGVWTVEEAVDAKAETANIGKEALAGSGSESNDTNTGKTAAGAGRSSDDEGVSDKVLAKKAEWERKLLDLGLRNSLINLRLSKSVVPILADSIDALEDALADGSDFTIRPKPENFKTSGEGLTFEDLADIGYLKDTVGADLSSHKLYSALTEAQLNSTIKDLYRTAKSSLEENGANTLYLALGLLRWYETNRSTTPRYAPLILLPIEITRQSALLGYRISLNDDDPQMNITLLEKLKQDFKIEINGLDPLPEDEHGIDTRKVFDMVKEGVTGMERWDVLETAAIGIFSFSQFVMWNDIRNRSDDLLRNKLVRSLMEGRLTWDATDMVIPDKVDVDDVYLPLSADGSQIYAIKSADSDNSFVLHGPPGTGKSQTITAMIANLMAQGKSVLFVAEKRAALEVVEERLEKIGIGAFCLELHSNKAQKKTVLDQLKRVMDITKEESAEEYAIKADQYAKLRKDLDGYADAIHEKKPCGMDLFQLVNLYEQCEDAPDCEGFDGETASKFTAAQILEQEGLLGRAAAAGKAVGSPSGHPLAAVHVTEYSQSLKNGMGSVIDAYESAVNALGDAASSFASAVGSEVPVNKEDLEHLYSLADEIEAWEGLPAAWAKTDKDEAYFNGIRDMIRHFNIADQYKDLLMTAWKPEFLSLDGNDLMSEYSQIQGKWAITKKAAMDSFMKKLKVYQNSGVSEEDLPKHFSALNSYRSETDAANEKLSACRDDLGSLYSGVDTDWSKVSDAIETASGLIAKFDPSRDTDEVRNSLLGSPAAMRAVRSFDDARVKYQSALKGMQDMLGYSEETGDENWFDGQRAVCEKIKNNTGDLREWISWNDISAQAEEAGLKPIIDYYLAGADPDSLIDVYHKALYKTLIEYYIDNTPVLNRFSGPVFNEKIEQFKRLDDELMKLTQKEIYCKLASRLPNFAKEASKSSDLGILQRAIRSNGRGVTIRKLFDQIPTLISRLCPCMLMSPISAAQYLSPDRDSFDVVIFDEASQLPTCKAVGVIARAKNAVIVGDPKQMPPTSFFSINTADEDNMEEEDLESILDDALALNMPSAHLLWHYRSRHESLIAFSNAKFYDNSMYTFPSVNDRVSKVSMVHVNGTFERGKNRYNKAEAEAIVQELIRRCHDPEDSKYSVGIVTFNISQQKLIDDMVNDACKNDPGLEKWCYDSDDPIFIKNLENVQGDERDVILFSIGYGPDENGKVYMNFGPLNRDGGWRRLNVAVTRSRTEMIVYSTLTPDQIDLTRTSSEGAAALKAFLEYADTGKLNIPAQSIDAENTKFHYVSDNICKALNEAGYETVKNVGKSEYKIDIGVVDPDDNDSYILGILLDGPAYGQSKTTRDREISQISMLDGLGWTIQRVWIMDWWDNREKELTKITDAIEEAKEAKKAAAEKLAAEREALKEQAVAEAAGAQKAEQEAAQAAEEAETEEKTDEEAEAQLSENAEGSAGESNGESDAGSDDVSAEESGQEDESRVPVYTAAVLSQNKCTADDLMSPAYNKMIREKVMSVIDAEAPVSRDMLVKRVLASCGIPKGGTKLQDHMDALLVGFGLNTNKTGDTDIYWRDDQDPADYKGCRASGTDDSSKRDVKDVPAEEAANAVLYVISEEVGIPKEELAKEAGKVLGYPRSSQALTDLTDSAVGYCQSRGWICEAQNGNLTLTDEGTAQEEAVEAAF